MLLVHISISRQSGMQLLLFIILIAQILYLLIATLASCFGNPVSVLCFSLCAIFDIIQIHFYCIKLNSLYKKCNSLF